MNFTLVPSLLAISFGFVSSESRAALVVAGSLQDEQGGGQVDWDPPHSTLIMTEKSGIHTVKVVNLIAGASYLFKVLDEQGTGPANWGDPEINVVDTLAHGGLDGTVTLTVDTNLTNARGYCQIWVNSDAAPLQVVGDFMDEAGGATDWNPADLAFRMTSRGNGLYDFAATISIPGTYQFKATYGTGWDHQIGTDGAGADAATHRFTTTRPDEKIVMSIDLASRKFFIKSAH